MAWNSLHAIVIYYKTYCLSKRANGCRIAFERFVRKGINSEYWNLHNVARPFWNWSIKQKNISKTVYVAQRTRHYAPNTEVFREGPRAISLSIGWRQAARNIIFFIIEWNVEVSEAMISLRFFHLPRPVDSYVLWSIWVKRKVFHTDPISLTPFPHLKRLKHLIWPRSETDYWFDILTTRIKANFQPDFICDRWRALATRWQRVTSIIFGRGGGRQFLV